MSIQLYPLTFYPIYKEKIWGGRKLQELFDRQLPAGLIGESWDVAAHSNGTSVVVDGPLAGKNLGELVSSYGRDLVDVDTFPLLVKLIDAQQDLSVQVHPDDVYVKNHTNERWGKTEWWYVIYADPGAWIIWGLKPGVTKQQFAKAVEAGGEEILACLNKVPVKPGEVYPISAGLVHALGAGVVVAEIQQNSDTTFRIYDWDRLDETGQSRELHVEQALETIDFSPYAIDREYQLARCAQHFHVDVLERPQACMISKKERFEILTCFGGPAEVAWSGGKTVLACGQSCLLPASFDNYVLSAQGVVLRSRTAR